MSAKARLPALAALVAVTVSGCASWNDRVSTAYDPVMTFLGARPQGQTDWPAARLPTLPPLATYGELLPDRQPMPATPGMGWPPLSGVADPSGGDGTTVAPGCTGDCAPAALRAANADPARAARGGEPLPSR